MGTSIAASVVAGLQLLIRGSVVPVAPSEAERLVDEVCLVTGGGSGIGQALVRRFAAAGMRVVVCDIESDAVAATVEALPDPARALGLTCDVRSAASMSEVRARTLERFGSVHLVCLNAGVAPTGGFLEAGLDVWDWVFDVNVRGVVLGLREFGPLLVERGRGHFVLTASTGGLSDTPFASVYGASKHAVVGLAAAARHEFAPGGVGVSVICPGATATRIFEGERNRPAGMADPTAGSALVAAMGELLATNGMSPAVVADVAYRAVLDDQFFVFPSTDFDRAIRQRLDDVRQGLAWRDAGAGAGTGANGA